MQAEPCFSNFDPPRLPACGLQQALPHLPGFASRLERVWSRKAACHHRVPHAQSGDPFRRPTASLSLQDGASCLGYWDNQSFVCKSAMDTARFEWLKEEFLNETHALPLICLRGSIGCLCTTLLFPPWLGLQRRRFSCNVMSLLRHPSQACHFGVAAMHRQLQNLLRNVVHCSESVALASS